MNSKRVLKIKRGRTRSTNSPRRIRKPKINLEQKG